MVFNTRQIHNVNKDVDFHNTDWRDEQFVQIRHSSRQYIELSLHPFTEHNVSVDNYKDGRNFNLSCQSIIVIFHFYRSIERFKYLVNFILFYCLLNASEVHFQNNFVYELAHDVHVINYVTNSHNDFQSDFLIITTHIQCLELNFHCVNVIQIR